MKQAGIGLFIVAVLLMGGALFYDPTVTAGGDLGFGANKVYNLGALQYQQLVFFAGVGAMVAGAVLYAAGELLEAMLEAGTAKRAPPVDPEAFTGATGAPANSDCSWCGRDMTPYAACSSASDEVNRERAPRVTDPVCQANFRERSLIADA